MKKIFLPLIAASALLTGADLDALQKECNGGNGASCYELGVLYDNAREGAAQDYQKAAELYSKACKLGNGGGCYKLGNLYAQGRGIKEDANAAENYLKKACDMEPELACDRYKEFTQK